MATNFCDLTDNIAMVTDRVHGMKISVQLVTIDGRTAMKYRGSLRGSSSSFTIFCDEVTDEEVFIDLTTLVEEVLESAGEDELGKSPVHPRTADQGSSWPPTWATRLFTATLLAYSIGITIGVWISWQ